MTIFYPKSKFWSNRWQKKKNTNNSTLFWMPKKYQEEARNLQNHDISWTVDRFWDVGCVLLFFSVFLDIQMGLERQKEKEKTEKYFWTGFLPKIMKNCKTFMKKTRVTRPSKNFSSCPNHGRRAVGARSARGRRPHIWIQIFPGGMKRGAEGKNYVI